MKKLVNLKGAKALNRKEQKEIYGGCGPTVECDGGGGVGGGSGLYCGCSGGDNQPTTASHCSWTVCNPLCNYSGNGSYTGVCIEVG